MQDIINWARSVLPQGDDKVEIVCETPYSRVARIGGYYLKQVPPAFMREAAVIRLLGKIAPGSVPELVAVNEDLRCFITPDCGTSMRGLVQSGGDPALLAKAAAACAKVQNAAVAHVDEFLALGLPDWRLARLPDLFSRLIARDWGLEADKADKLKRAADAFAAGCAELAAFGIPESIEPVDFNTKNALVGADGGITIIDLGEAVVSHPFFTLKRFLASVSRHHGVDDAYIRTAYLPHWQGDTARAFEIVERICLPCAALAHEQLEDACGDGAWRVKDTLLAVVG